MNNDSSNSQGPVIITGPTVITTPIVLPPPVTVHVSATALVLSDMVIFRNDPLPAGEFEVNLDSAALQRSGYYVNRYGKEFLNVPDHYFIYEGAVNTAQSGAYFVSGRINPAAAAQADIAGILGNYVCMSVVVVADSEADAARLYSDVLKNRGTEDSIIEKGRARSLSLTTPTLRGLFGFPAIYTAMLMDAFQTVINNELTNAKSRQKLGLPQGNVTRQELFIWARQQEENQDFRQKIVVLFISIIPTLQEKVDKNTAGSAERNFLEKLKNHIRQNKINATIDAINGYNQHIKDDDAHQRRRLPLLQDAYLLGHSRVPDKYLQQAMTGIPDSKIQNNLLAVAIASVGVECGIVLGATGAAIGVHVLLPYSAALGEVTFEAFALIGGPVAIGLTVFATIFAGAVEKVVHDVEYGSKLWTLYQDAQKEVRVVDMLKSKSTINMLIANLLEFTMTPSVGLVKVTSAYLQREVHRPIR